MSFLTDLNVFVFKQNSSDWLWETIKFQSSPLNDDHQPPVVSGGFLARVRPREATWIDELLSSVSHTDAGYRFTVC